jgi:hypothetical protein
MEEKPKLQVFYEGLVKDNYKVPDYATFEQTLKDPAKSKVFYDGLISENYKLPEFETFVTDLGLKKKDASDYGLPTKQVFADMFATVSKEKPEVSERPADPIDPEKYKVPAPDMKEPQFSYPGGPFANLFAQSMKRNIDEETFKQHAQERIGEIDKELEGLKEFAPKMNIGAPPYATYALPTGSEGEKKREDLIQQRNELAEAITSPKKREWFASRVYNNTIVGLASKVYAEAITGEKEPYQLSENWLSKYDPTTIEDISAMALGFVADNPLFTTLAVPGKVVAKEVAMPLAKRLMNTTVDKLVKSGVKREIAEKYAMKGAEKFLIGSLSSATSLGGYTGLHDALGQWADPEKDFKDIDFGQTLSATMRDAGLGAGVGGLGTATSALAQKAKAIPSVAGRVASQAGIQSGGLTAESGLFVYGGAVLDDRKMKSVTAQEVVETALLLGTMKLSHAVQDPKMTAKGIRQSMAYDPQKPGQGQFQVDIEPWELNSIGGRDYNSLMKDLSKDGDKLSVVMQNPSIPVLLKQKLLWGSKGLAMEKANLNAEKVANNGEYLEFYNKEGVLVDKRKYATSEEAVQEGIELGLQLEDNKMQARSAEPDVDKVKIITDLKNKGTNIPKLLTALDKPVSERTPEESKMVGDYYSMIPKPKEEKKPEGGGGEEKPARETDQTLSLGDKSFADKDELMRHLEDVAINKETGELDKAWFDREINAWPNMETVKVINDWTEAKKAEIRTRQEAKEKADLEAQKKVEPKKPEAPETPMETGVKKVAQKEFDKNGLIDEVRRYSDMTASEKKKNAMMANTIRVNAQRLGYEVKEGDVWKVGVTKDGKFLTIRKDPMKVDKAKTEGQKLLGEYDKDFQDYVNEVLDTNPDLFGVMIGGLSNEQRVQAFKNIKAGKKTAASLTALSELERMYKTHGGIDVWHSEGKFKVGISREEIQKAKDELISRGRGALAESYDIDKDLENGLITKLEYDEINEHYKRADEQDRIAEEDFNAGETGDNKGGTEKGAGEEIKPEADEKPISEPNPPVSKGEENIVPGGTEGVSKPVEAEGREKPVRTTDVGKQKQIDAIDKEYDARIAEAQKELEGMTDEKRNKVIRDAEAEVNRRNTIFGDTDAIKDGVIKPEDQGFKVSNKPVEEAVRKFDERKKELQNIIEPLNKERESKIGEVLKQQTLGFKEPVKVETINISDILNENVDGQKLSDAIVNVKDGLTSKTEGKILLYKKGDKYEVGDGFHRIAEAIQRGETTIKAEVHTEDPLQKKAEGIKFKDKNYTDIEQVQDDLADGKITFDESKTLMEDVRKFEDRQRTQAKKTSDDIENLINKSADDVEKQIQDEINDENSKLHSKIYLDLISRGTTSLYKPLKEIQVKLSDFIASGLIKGVKSQNDIIRWTTKTITNLYDGLLRTDADIHGRVYYKEGDIFNQKIVPERKIGKLEMLGTAKSYAKYKGLNLLNELHTIVNNDPTAWQRTWSVLDPELANFQTSEGVLKGAEKERPLQYGDLSLSEKNMYWALKKWNTWLWSTNYANEIVSTESYLKFKGDFDVTGYSDYIARMYDAYEESPLQTPEIQEFIKSGNSAVVTKRMITDYMKFRGEVNEWKAVHAIKDPAYLTAKRVMQTIQNVAIKKYMELVIAEHPEFVKTIKEGEAVPKGYTQLSNSYNWGPFRGKAVINHIVEDFTGFHYSNVLMNTAYDMIKIVDRTGFNQFYKKFRTVLNPFVQTGNIAGNSFLASINGINPIEFAKEELMARNTHKKNPALFETLLRDGLIGDVAMTGEMKPGEALTEEKNLYTKVSDWASEMYVGADNVAKIAAYKIYRKHGLDHRQAVRRAYDAFQNYATVGKTWDFASKIPAIGPTFVKFQADLQRIMANSLLTTPLTTIGTFMLIKLAGNLASTLSGESEEEQEIRESRRGVPKIPFLDIPLSFKVGNTEVNVARYLTPLFIYPQGDSEMDIYDMSKFMPIQLQKPKAGSKIPLPAFADATWGFLGSILADRDFRNVPIQDPYRTQYTDPNIGEWERFTNVMRFTARSQVPFYRSTEDLINGMTGQLDYYGRKRDWKQAIFNNFIKVQEFGDTELRSYMERNIDYLTNRFAALSENMGDANTVFMREIKKAEDLELSDEAMAKLYEKEDKKRSQRMQKSLDEQMPVMAELERVTGVYKKWFPDSQFIQENFIDIEAGKTRRFNVENNVDLQKKYPYEYKLLKNYNILKPPREVPTHINEKQLTEEQRKQYVNIYWKEYLQYLDNQIGLTEEEFKKMEENVLREEKNGAGGLPKKVTMIDKISEKAYVYAKSRADSDIRYVITVKNK